VTIAQSFSLQGDSRPGSVTLAAVLQGFPADVLARNNVNFGEGAVGLVLAVAIALGLVALAVLYLAGNPVGRIGSWIVQPLLLIAGILIMSGQVFTARFLASAFKSSGDATLAGINVKAFVDAATGAYPAWFPYVVTARFVLATLGSLLVSILLAVRSANAYFR
jgi:hypothetical protein